MINKMKGFPRCYVVNLEESADRREYMTNEFRKLGINDSVILRHRRLEDNSEGFLNIVGDPELLKILPLGATTSHLLSIKWWYENTDEEMAAFFEDDCDFSTIQYWNFNFEDYLKKFGVLWDALQLCVMHEGWPVMYPRHRLGWDHGLQCYIIKRHYAKKLIDYYFLDDNTINFEKMPYTLRSHEPRRYKPTIENVIYGLGIVYIHPLFNHNISFSSTVHDASAKDLQQVAEKSYNYVKKWWEGKGNSSTLEQIFDYEYCCPPGQMYGGVLHIDR